MVGGANIPPAYTPSFITRPAAFRPYPDAGWIDGKREPDSYCASQVDCTGRGHLNCVASSCDEMSFYRTAGAPNGRPEIIDGWRVKIRINKCYTPASRVTGEECPVFCGAGWSGSSSTFLCVAKGYASARLDILQFGNTADDQTVTCNALPCELSPTLSSSQLGWGDESGDKAKALFDSAWNADLPSTVPVCASNTRSTTNFCYVQSKKKNNFSKSWVWKDHDQCK